MEPSGQSQVYYHHDNPHRIWDAWPNSRAGINPPPKATGSAAEQIYNRADFYCVNHGGFEWMVESNPDHMDFTIHRTNPYTDEDYQMLVQALEKRTGKTGLTIIVY